jgi:hypothetical protein
MALASNNKNDRKRLAQNRPRTPMTAYYRGKSAPDDASPFIKKTPKRRWRRYVYGLMDIILIAILVSLLIYSLMIQPNPKVQADDFAFHSRQDYQVAAARQLAKFNNRNKITFDQVGLEKALKNQFPEIRDVQVELPLFSERPTINLAIDQASLFLNSRGVNYVIDASGRAVAKSANLPDVKGLPAINDASGFKIAPGQAVLSADSVDFIKTLIAQCRLAKVAISSLELPPVAQELDLKAKNQPYYVKFYLGGDALIQSGQYLAARQHFNDQDQPTHYLDVRVPGKVFYK